MSIDLIARGLAARTSTSAQAAQSNAANAQASATAAAGSATTASNAASTLTGALAQVSTTVGTIIRANLLTLEDGIAAPRVMTYTATAGRYRLTASGFAICAANEERLCYDPAGRFLGSMLQPADTYYSAPWHDATAPHTATDPAYLTATSGTGTAAYAGAHTEADVFGTNGRGVLLTQGSSASQYWTASNVKVTAAIGDVLRAHAIVAVAPSVAGTFTLRTRGANAIAFAFPYDASGAPLAITESWASYRFGYHDLGTLNGKRWIYVWGDYVATAAGDTQASIGFGTADTSQKLHVCELMIQKNPVAAPAAVPVCAAAKTFAADTISTGITQNVGYVMPYLAAARSMAPSGKITAPAISVGLPYLPIEKDIRVVHSTETVDRSGILHNGNEAYAFTPWKTPATWTVGLGPGSFPTTISFASNKGATNYTLQPVFTQRPELAPLVKKIIGNITYITGALTVDGCVLLGMADTATSYWEQTDIRSSTDAMQYLAGATATYARGCLVMGCPQSHTRAYWQAQDDDTDEQRNFVGEFTCTVTAGTIDVSGSRFERIGRGPFVQGSTASSAVAFNCNDTYFDLIWSDGIYPTKGTFTNPTGHRRFHGRFTAKDQSFWQTRKEIEVDLLDGAGWRAFSASGLTEAQLPVGKRASHFGTYDFTAATLTEDPDPDLSMMLRRWTKVSSSAVYDKPGYQWHNDQVETAGKTYTRYPDPGSVWIVATDTMRIRFVVDAGYYNQTTGAWVTGAAGTPAVGQTSTHADNFQTNTASLTWKGFAADKVFMYNGGQGPYMAGSSTATVDGVTMRNHVLVLTETNGTIMGGASQSAACAITMSDCLLVQRKDPWRYGSGGAETTRIYVTGNALTTLTLDNVHVATANSVDVSVGASAVLVGAAHHINVPAISAHDTVAAVARPCAGNLFTADMLDPVYGVVRDDIVPRDLRFSAYAEARTGIALNAIVTACIGDHPRWDALIADIVHVYFKAPDIKLTIPAATAVGTVFSLGGKIKASSFHPTHGNHRRGYFTLDGIGNLVVAKTLTGINDIRLLRTALDETILIDIT